MGDLLLLSARQMARISPHFPLSHGVARVDDQRVVSGIVYVIRNGLQWKDSPLQYGPLGVFDRIFAALAGKCHTVANASERPDTGAEATAR